jgi:benzodiazapine receptor
MVTGQSRILNWCNILTYVTMVIVNGLAGSTTLLGGKFTSEISDANPTLITPAGYVFGIWGIIYILLGVFVIYQVLPRGRTAKFHEQIGWLFAASSVVNILWLFAWQYEYLLVSVILMFLLLGGLILIYLRLDIGRSKVGWEERLAVHLPFSVYLGWITIATIANVSVYLVSIGWEGFGIGPETWAALILVIATAVAALVMITRRDIAYALVIVWAFVGIAVNQESSPTVVTLTMAGVAVVAVALALSILRARRRTVGGSPA